QGGGLSDLLVRPPLHDRRARALRILLREDVELQVLVGLLRAHALHVRREVDRGGGDLRGELAVQVGLAETVAASSAGPSGPVRLAFAPMRKPPTSQAGGLDSFLRHSVRPPAEGTIMRGRPGWNGGLPRCGGRAGATRELVLPRVLRHRLERTGDVAAPGALEGRHVTSAPGSRIRSTCASGTSACRPAGPPPAACPAWPPCRTAGPSPRSGSSPPASDRRASRPTRTGAGPTGWTCPPGPSPPAGSRRARRTRGRAPCASRPPAGTGRRRRP